MTRGRLLFVVVLLAAAAVAALLVLVLGGEDADDASSAASGECESVEAPAPKDVSFKEPEQVLERGEQASALVETNCGAFTIALDTEGSPKTANSFAFLAEEGFYDGTIFHRIAPEFVIQGGDPLGTGTGGPGYSVTERPPPDAAYLKGTVAMAKNGVEAPGTSGSQFFVVTAPADAGLTPDYALLGEVSEGIEVVEAIGELGGGGATGEEPLETVLIESVTIERG